MCPDRGEGDGRADGERLTFDGQNVAPCVWQPVCGSTSRRQRQPRGRCGGGGKGVRAWVSQFQSARSTGDEKGDGTRRGTRSVQPNGSRKGGTGTLLRKLNQRYVRSPWRPAG